jgi:saccharopine dehydrogenase (NAD+, L-lysine-forming)
LVSRAAEELDSVDEAEIAVAASGMDADGPASALHFIHQMGSDAPYVTDYEPASEKAGVGPRLVYFPEPVGWIETFHSGHPEVATLVRKHPGLRALHYHIGLTEKQAMDVVRGSVALGFARTEARRQTWLKLTHRSRGLLGRLPPRGPIWTAARVNVWGVREDRTAAVSLGVVDRIANLASVPLVLGAVEIAAGRAGKPGLHGTEEIFAPRPFLKALTQRGIRVARLEPRPV